MLKKVLLAVFIIILVAYIAVSAVIYYKYYRNIRDPYSFFKGEKVSIVFFPKDIKHIINFNKYDTDYTKHSTYKPRSQKYKNVLDEAMKYRQENNINL